MTKYQYAIRDRAADPRHVAYENLMSDLLIDAAKVASGRRAPWFRWDSPRRAMAFLRGERARFWASLIDVDISRIIIRLDSDVTDCPVEKKFPSY